MTLPPQNQPFSEGGPPQSQVAPGDTERELIHEVRNLATQVALLHTIFVKRTVLYWILGIETAIVAICLLGLFVFAAVNNSDTNHLIEKSTGSCQIRNQQTDSTKTFLLRETVIQKESAQLSAKYFTRLHVVLSPGELALAAKIQHDQSVALNDWYKNQPNDVKCSDIKP